MAISQFDKPAELPKVDFDFLLKARELGEAKQEKVAESADKMGELFTAVKALPGDTGYRNERVKNYYDRLNNWYNTYKGKESSGLNDLKAIKRDFEYEINTGKLGKVHSNALYSESNKKSFAEASQKGDYAGMEDVAYFNIIGKPEQNFVTEEVTPGSGIYTSPKYEQPTKYSDLGKDFIDLANQWASNKGYGTLKKDNYGYLSSVTHEYIDPNEVITGVMAYAKADPKYSRQLEHMKNFYNASYVEPYKQTPNYRETIEPSGRKISYLETTDEYGNPIGIPMPDAENMVNQKLFELAGVAGSKYGYDKYGIDYKENWLLKKALEDQEKQKPISSSVGLYAPSVESPYNTYWDREKLALNPPSKLSTASSMAMSTPWMVPGLVGVTSGFIAGGGKGKPLTEKQKTDLNKAEKVFGRVSTDNETQFETLSKYYDYMGSQMENIPWQFPGDSSGNIDFESANKKAASINNFYFGNPENPSGSAVNTNVAWKEIGSGKVISGVDLKRKVGKPDIHFKWMGSLPDDNFYFPAGEGFEAIDSKGNVIGRYVTESPNSKQYQTGWEFYQSKMGEDIKLSFFPKYTVSYKRGFNSTTLDDKGYPIREFENDVVILKDVHGNEILKSTPGSPDPVADLYNQFKELVNSGKLK